MTDESKAPSRANQGWPAAGIGNGKDKEVLPTLFTILGIGLCLPLPLILAAWSWQAWNAALLTRRHFLAWQAGARRVLDRADARQATAPAGLVANAQNAGWSGWRRFRVASLQRELANATSVWLEPVDGKPIAAFQPGQYLTIQLKPGGSPKSLTRCYSLSAPVHDNRYRLTVKAVARDGTKASALSVSHHINHELMVGDLVEARAPLGDFVLDPSSEAPLVMLAAGVGITPLFCMIEELIARQSTRQIVLLYGNRNSAEHIFRQRLAQLAASTRSLSLVNCYSHPLPDDAQGREYQIQGQVSIGLLQQLLPHRKFQFCLCGPPGFMQGLVAGLLEWGVPPERILREAFGPASIPVAKPAVATDDKVPGGLLAEAVPVSFSLSDRQIELNDQERSILELAETISVEISSGCRAGSCGSCAVRLLKGKVRYREKPSAEIDPGYCLACIAQPDGPVEVEA